LTLIFFAVFSELIERIVPKLGRVGAVLRATTRSARLVIGRH